MPALVAGIHVLTASRVEDVDGRNKSGHDGRKHRLRVPLPDRGVECPNASYPKNNG